MELASISGRQRLASSTGPTRVDTPDDEGRASHRKVVVKKQGDDGESPKNRSQLYSTIIKNI
jgi:hypothetical protein